MAADDNKLVHFDVSGCLVFYAREIRVFIVDDITTNYTLIQTQLKQQNCYCSKDNVAHLEFLWDSAPPKIPKAVFA